MFIAYSGCRSVSDKHGRYGYETRDNSRHTRVLTIDGLLFLRMIVMTDDDDKVNMDDGTYMPIPGSCTITLLSSNGPRSI